MAPPASAADEARPHRSGVRTRLAALALLVAALASSSPARTIRDHRDPSREGGAYGLTADGVFEVTLTRQRLQATVCETRNLTGRADPVLHVLRLPAPDGAVSEIARDDDSGGALNARVRFVPPAAGRYLLIMRAAGAGAGGTADLYCDGRPVWLNIGVGGAFKRLENLDRRESLRTVTLPGGPQLHRLYLLDDSGRLLARHVAGANDSVHVNGGLVGTRNAMVGGFWPDPPGEIRLIRNDVGIPGRDPDGDGLGSRLEANIGTCSSRSGLGGDFECARAADARDTDGDGLRDGLELIGSLDRRPFQHLPRWGADPRHKDVFIEVDFGLAARNEAPQRMMPDQALAFMDAFGDSEPDRFLRLFHAQSLTNPDQQAGINVHLDTGVSPPAGALRLEQVTYGDWGGHGVVAPVCDGAGCRRAQAGAVWRTMMDPVRRGIFHYALGDPGGGGQASIGAIALNFPMGNGRAAAHEFGHTLGLEHMGGPRGLNCMPNYPSLMNYGYYIPDPKRSFADGLGRASLNDVALRERGAVADPAGFQGRRYLDDLERIYRFNVNAAAGDVDWNRDGVFSPQPVRGFATFQPGAGCEGTRDSQIMASGLSDRAPALVRFAGRTMLLYIDERDRRLRLEIASGDLNCPAFEADCGRLIRAGIPFAWNRGLLAMDAHPLVVGGGRRLLVVVFRTGEGLFEVFFDGSFWTTPRRIETSAGPAGELSLAGAGGRMWLAFRGTRGRAILKTRTLPQGWGPDEIIRDGSGVVIGRIPADASPAILLVNYRDGREVLLGAFPVGPQGDLRLYQRDMAPVLAPDTGRPLPLDGLWRLAPWPIVTNLSEQEGGGIVLDPTAPEPVVAPAIGKPALAFEPMAPESPLPGRVHLLYTQRATDGRTMVMQGFLIAQRQSGILRPLLLIAQHDNIWLYGKGVDLLFEPGVDTNLRAALASALLGDAGDPPLPHNVWLRPKADGIIDFPQRNFNDWEVLGRGLCVTLARNGASVTCPAGG